jgi:hypothetical protein
MLQQDYVAALVKSCYEHASEKDSTRIYPISIASSNEDVNNL